MNQVKKSHNLQSRHTIMHCLVIIIPVSHSKNLTSRSISLRLLLILTGVILLTSCSTSEPVLATSEAETPLPATETIMPLAQPLEVVGTMTATAVKKKETPTPIDPREEDMKKEVQVLAGQKLVSSSKGTYYRVQDFTGEWAKLSYYHWWPLNRKPTNFAIRADVSWESAVPMGNPSKSGCGFVFHENGASDLHVSFLSMDGYVRNYRTEKNVITNLKGNYAGKFNYPADKARIMLVVDYQWLTFYVNGKQVVRFQDDRLNGGGLAFAVASGSNNSFGTRCTFQNVDLWEFN